MNRPRARAQTVAAAALLIALASGCSSAQAPRGSGTATVVATTGSSSPAPETSDGRVVVGVTQGRSDYTTARFAITVENVTGDDMIVRSARLSSSSFVTDVAWDGEATVPSGRTRDLRVVVPRFVCPVSDPTMSVEIFYETSGATRSAVLSPSDEFDTIERMSDVACFTEAVSGIAELGLSDDLVISGSGSTAVATLSLIVTPATGASERSLHVLGVEATTLLSPASGAASWGVDEKVSMGDAPRIIALAAVPARCDAHAIAEDKVGTVLRVRALLPDGTEGVVSVPASAPLRASLYAFIADACGISG